MSCLPKYLYKVVARKDWDESLELDFLPISPMDRDFIHFATEEQLGRVIEKFWEGKDYVVLEFEVCRLPGRLVYETNPGGTMKYYHLYEGHLPKSALLDVGSCNDGNDRERFNDLTI